MIANASDLVRETCVITSSCGSRKVVKPKCFRKVSRGVKGSEEGGRKNGAIGRVVRVEEAIGIEERDEGTEGG